MLGHNFLPPFVCLVDWIWGFSRPFGVGGGADATGERAGAGRGDPGSPQPPVPPQPGCRQAEEGTRRMSCLSLASGLCYGQGRLCLPWPLRGGCRGAGVWQGPEAAGLAPRWLTGLLCGFQLLREPFQLGRPVSSSSTPGICVAPVKNWDKVLPTHFMEAAHLKWLPSSRAGFGPTAQMHQPDRIKVGF